DGIRDFHVTGVQTCALPISGVWRNHGGPTIGGGQRGGWPEDAPYTDEAQRRIAEYRALVEGTGETPGSFCVGTGMPGSMLGSGEIGRASGKKECRWQMEGIS